MPTSTGDLALELRRAEGEIDRAHLANKLVNRPFGEAAWHYLALCEGRLMGPMINPASRNMLQDKHAMGEESAPQKLRPLSFGISEGILQAPGGTGRHGWLLGKF